MRPTDAFHVICPSLPGFGFSGKPDNDRLGRRTNRRCLGDTDGATGLRAIRRPGRRLGLGGDDDRSARTIASTARPSTSRWRWRTRPGRGEPTPEDSARSKGSQYYSRLGFRLLQAASDAAADAGLRPGRFAVGQAAWILEKFWAWTDCDGHPENVLTRDEMLDNVMMYWVDQQRRPRSARLYWESFGKRRAVQRSVPPA